MCSPNTILCIRTSFCLCQHMCPDCGKVYTLKHNLTRHQRLECNKEPQFSCHLCPYRAKQKSKLKYHLYCKHGEVQPSRAYLNL
ncbi:longitudinals lacking protein, isoforms A/B/D/L-like [Macrosteles quadrilineatus]|uniref:longitudinals lacking protein, isoforms A/B/D/L-like n=1 Tax=Macrosteles quadrilineatus TaxID=74068 RepID=UPI0023E1B006|nr:longitudinals lacking protein, isoforms A/B/D/L-like [Macrosteles quadrilineatus]